MVVPKILRDPRGNYRLLSTEVNKLMGDLAVEKATFGKQEVITKKLTCGRYAVYVRDKKKVLK